MTHFPIAQRSWLSAYVRTPIGLKGIAGDHSGDTINALDGTLLAVGSELVGLHFTSFLHSIPSGLDGSAWQIAPSRRSTPYLLGTHDFLVHHSAVIIGFGIGRGPDRGRQR